MCFGRVLRHFVDFSQPSPVGGVVRVVGVDMLTSEYSIKKRRMRFSKGGPRVRDLSATRNLENQLICGTANGVDGK